MTIHFLNVGRDKKSWNAEVPDLSDRTLINQIRRQGALMSRDIDFNWNNADDGGVIYVGMFRNVGKFSVEGGCRVSGI